MAHGGSSSSLSLRGPRTSELRAERTLAQLMLMLCVRASRGGSQSDVMLAQLSPSGTIELLNAAAWSRALGYVPEELSGKSPHQLMALEHAERFDPSALEPFDVSLRYKDEGRKRLRLHRRFDPYEQAVFLIAEELSG